MRFLGRDKDAVSEALSEPATPAPDVSDGLIPEAHTDGSTRANSAVPPPSDKENPEEEKNSTEPESLKATEVNPDDDIEMGELEEDPKEKEAAVKKPMVEELEEGETFEGSSELSEPPDDSDDEL